MEAAEDEAPRPPACDRVEGSIALVAGSVSTHSSLRNACLICHARSRYGLPPCAFNPVHTAQTQYLLSSHPQSQTVYCQALHEQFDDTKKKNLRTCAYDD